jgi:glutamate-1-semialdehyde 2,1-aminomutase
VIETISLYALGSVAAAVAVLKTKMRLELSVAKHRSLAGHPRMARRVAALLPHYDYSAEQFFAVDGAPDEVIALRKAGYGQLSHAYKQRYAMSVQHSEDIEPSISDLQFINGYRVPFQFASKVRTDLKTGSFVKSTSGVMLTDLDDNISFDLTGSFGVNVFGNDFYKGCIERGSAKVNALGPVLGSYHPVVIDNVQRLKHISGMDEVSFHMSGTEAVMQAVRLARYHTKRTHLVRFCGSYHGWWGDVQPGVGNPSRAHDTYNLKEMDEATLRVLRTRKDIACVLVNPLQALHPNASAPGDSSLIDSSRSARFDRVAYTAWLHQLREVCDERGIALIFDEVFMGFRLAAGGAQSYFGVKADLVTYGKTLGGGLPIGVVCGQHRWMKRFNDHAPADICFARGTFNSHPYVMGAMNEFLLQLDQPEIKAIYAELDGLWDGRAARLNARLEAAGLPVRVANLSSIWTVTYTTPSRYNWMFQYYLRLQGLALSWVGTGRLIFSLNYTELDFMAVADRFVEAAQAMQAHGWWWAQPLATNKAIKRSILREMVKVRWGSR